MTEVRIFVAGTEGIVILAPAPGVEESYDVLVSGGVHPDNAADLSVGFARHGYDPVVMARKFLRARSAVS